MLRWKIGQAHEQENNTLCGLYCCHIHLQFGFLDAALKSPSNLASTKASKPPEVQPDNKPRSLDMTLGLYLLHLINDGNGQNLFS